MAPPSVASDSVLLGGASAGSRTSTRFSTYSSKAGSDSLSDSTYVTRLDNDAEIREYRLGLKRLEDEKMQNQRYQLSQAKRDEQSALALVGKVQRSLERRYHNQDAEMRPKKASALSEKVAA